MSNSALRIFVRTITRKMELTGQTLEEILENDYPKLSEEFIKGSDNNGIFNS